MGRYYSGDIEGKFAFAIQSSDDADNFGVTGEQPEELYYCFDEDNLPDIKAELKRCKDNMKGHFKAVDKFFKELKMGYNNKMIAEKLDIPESQVKELLVYYFRHELGEKIKKCVEDKGYCEFTAEC